MKKQIFCPIESHEDSALPFRLRVYSFTPVFPEVFDLSGGGVTLTAFLCWDPAVPALSLERLFFSSLNGLGTPSELEHMALWLSFYTHSCLPLLSVSGLVFRCDAGKWVGFILWQVPGAEWPTILTCRLAWAGGSVTLHILLGTFQCKPCSGVHSRKIFFFFYFLACI